MLDFFRFAFGSNQNEPKTEKTAPRATQDAKPRGPKTESQGSAQAQFLTPCSNLLSAPLRGIKVFLRLHTVPGQFLDFTYPTYEVPERPHGLSLILPKFAEYIQNDFLPLKDKGADFNLQPYTWDMTLVLSFRSRANLSQSPNR